MTKVKRYDNKNRLLDNGEYQRKDGTYEWRYNDPITKKRRAIYAKTLKELRERKKETERTLSAGVSTERLTVDQLFGRWDAIRRLEMMAGTIKRSTYETTLRAYTLWVQPWLGHRVAATLKRTDIEAHYLMLKLERGLSRASIKLAHAALSSIFSLAVMDNLMAKNPTDGAFGRIARAQYEKKSQRALFLDDFALERFWAYLRGRGRNLEWLLDSTRFLALTGLRIGELGGITPENFDEEAKTLKIEKTIEPVFNRQERKGEYVISRPKTEGSARTIPLIPEAAEIISRRIREGKTATETIDGVTGFVFCKRNGRAITAKNYWTSLTWQIDRYNRENPDTPIPYFSAHSLRHTFATRAVAAGVNVKATQALLGHADVRTTLNIYAENTTDFAREELKKLTPSNTTFSTTNATAKAV